MQVAGGASGFYELYELQAHYSPAAGTEARGSIGRRSGQFCGRLRNDSPTPDDADSANAKYFAAADTLPIGCYRQLDTDSLPMNVRRGLLRLWVLTSGLWIALCLIVGAYQERWFEPNNTYQLTMPTGAIVTVEAPQEIPIEKVVTFAQNATHGWHGARLKMPRDGAYATVFWMAFILPVITITLGSALYWAFAGFAKR